MNDTLMHYGTPRMQRGVRRYQNRDGTWTELGKQRRRKGDTASTHPGKNKDKSSKRSERLNTKLSKLEKKYEKQNRIYETKKMKAEKRLSSIDWGNIGRDQMQSAYRHKKKADKIMKKIDKTKRVIDTINTQETKRGNEWINNNIR